MVRNNGMIYFRWLRSRFHKRLKHGWLERINHQENEQVTNYPQLTINSQLNNNKMKLLQFNAEQFETGNYDLVTADGKAVKFGHIDKTERAAIFGYINSFAYIWDINGVCLTNKTINNKNDLRLKHKAQTLYITITLGKNDRINTYASSDGQPKVKSGSKLLKRLEVAFDELDF